MSRDTTITCDRCGAKYPDLPRLHGAEAVFLDIKKTSINYEHVYYDDVDLCKNCTLALHKWMKNDNSK